jgi:hypothetical protein
MDDTCRCILKRLDALESKVARLSGNEIENCSNCNNTTAKYNDGSVDCQWWGNIPYSEIRCQHYDGIK